MHTKKIPVFTKKQLDVARRTNMLAFMQGKGEIFEKVSSKFVEHVDHDSMRANVKNGIVNWYSEGISSYDNAIEFCMAYYNEPYEDTVQQLLDYQFSKQISKTTTQKWIKQEEKNPFNLQHLSVAGNYDTGRLDKKGWAYLRSRHLSDETIGRFADGSITSDNRGNILFKITDIGKNKFGTYVGADVQGTYAKPLEKRMKINKKGELKLDRKYFKGIAENSNGRRGFCFGANMDYKSPITLFVTEAPIESLSLWELDKENLPNNSFFLSLSGSGTKQETIWKTYKDLQNMLNINEGTIVMAVNNDKAGKELIRAVHCHYKQSEDLKQIAKLSLYLPPIENGDFNECLELKKTGRLESREIKKKENEQAKAIFEQQKSAVQEMNV
ncbi:toprim domain-containing protein [Enterococcus faecalis]|uniref:toprim domain-containing protein n=1 Tax=Enterococcus faecalis TaxID=1351 RepID=UPI003CC5EBC7